MNESLELMSDDYPPPGPAWLSQEWLDQCVKSFDVAAKSDIVLGIVTWVAPANYIILDFKIMPDGAHFEDIEQEFHSMRQRMFSVLGIPKTLIVP